MIKHSTTTSACDLRRCCAIAAAASALTAPVGQVLAASPAPWMVSGDVWGKPKKTGDFHGDPSKDVSGLACAPQTSGRRMCLLVDDESQGAQIVILTEGKLTAGGFVRLITDAHEGKAVELDAEGVAYDPTDGAFYVTGSHGRPRHEADAKEEAKNQAKAMASRRVVRIRFGEGVVNPKTGALLKGRSPQIAVSEALPGFIQAQEGLKASFDTPLEKNGLTIEGLAIDSGRLVVGFRGPVLASGEAILLSVPLDALFDGKAGTGELIPVDLRDKAGKARGVRDLVASTDGFLGLAGPVNDPPTGTPIKCGDYAIFSRSRTKPLQIQELEPFAPVATSESAEAKSVKPEGLTPLDAQGDKPRVLLTFDGPPAGRPTPVMGSFGGAASCGAP